MNISFTILNKIFNKINNYKFFIITALLFINSCGFTSVYYNEKSESKTDDYHNELILVKIKKYRSNISRELYRDLTGILNPHNLETEKKYLLDIKLKDKLSSTFTTSTGSSGRNKITLIANYKLTDIESGALIGYGKSDESSDFDVSYKRFANYTTEERVKLDLTELIAKDIRNMIINDLYKLCQNCQK